MHFAPFCHSQKGLRSVPVYDSYDSSLQAWYTSHLRSKGIDPKGTKMMRRLTVGRAQGGHLMRVPFLKFFFLVGCCGKTCYWHLLVIFDMHFLETMVFQFFDAVF